MKIPPDTMNHSLKIALGAVVAGAGFLWFLERTRADWPDDPGERVALARERRNEEIGALFETAGVPYPPAQIYLRAFKEEGQLELWARGPDDSKYTQIYTFTVKARSGKPGPKRKEGDLQVPEGFYVVDRFNPKSAYHLSIGLNYPNASDGIRTTDPENPGSDIFVHGGRWTIGCLPIGDAGIETLYVVALDTKKNGGRIIAAHIFPCRMEGEQWTRLCEEHPEHVAFWEELRPALEEFGQTRTVPEFRVEEDGRYVLSRD